MTDNQKSILELMNAYDLTEFQHKSNLYDQIEYLNQRIGGEDIFNWLLPIYKRELENIKTKDIWGNNA